MNEKVCRNANITNYKEEVLAKSILYFTNTDIHGPWDTLSISTVDHHSLFQRELSAFLFYILQVHIQQWTILCVCVCVCEREEEWKKEERV